MQTIDLCSESLFVKLPIRNDVASFTLNEVSSGNEATAEQQQAVLSALQAAAIPTGKCVKVCEVYTLDDGRQIKICWCEWV